MKNRSEIVKQSLSYYFKTINGDWNVPENMPFMNEFLSSVEKLTIENDELKEMIFALADANSACTLQAAARLFKEKLKKYEV